MILSDLFEINYGTNLELNALSRTEDGINFVSRTIRNNGVSAKVKPIENIKPIPAGSISVALGGFGVLTSHVQPAPYYTGRDVAYLIPKKQMTLNEKIFYCLCIRKNNYKYSYGRQANKTLSFIEMPSKIPKWVKEKNVPNFNYLTKSYKSDKIKIHPNWKYFLFNELFDIKSNKSVRVNEVLNKKGDIALVSASAINNGVIGYVDVKKEQSYEGNLITVPKNGNGVGEAFYQIKKFAITTDVVVLVPKFKLNPYIAMFLITIIRKEKYKYNYGRKWNRQRMESTVLKLPYKNNNPDWQYMENYIKSLKYSANI